MYKYALHNCAKELDKDVSNSGVIFFHFYVHWWAFKLSVPIMYNHMCLQISFPVKSLAADMTGKWLLSRVNQHMYIQLRFTHTFPVAVWTWKELWKDTKGCSLQSKHFLLKKSVLSPIRSNRNMYNIYEDMSISATHGFSISSKNVN